MLVRRDINTDGEKIRIAIAVLKDALKDANRVQKKLKPLGEASHLAVTIELLRDAIGTLGGNQ